MEDELLRGTNDRRLRPRAVGVRGAPPMTASQASAEGRPLVAEPVAGAPGWRVTRRAAAPVEGAAGTPRRPRATPVVRPSERPEGRSPEAAPGRPAVLARPPRRVAAVSGRRGRGISLLALAAAAVVVVFVLGLAALDAQRRDLPVPWGEQAATPSAATALPAQARSNGLHPGSEAALDAPGGAGHGF